MAIVEKMMCSGDDVFVFIEDEDKYVVGLYIVPYYDISFLDNQTMS